uniref:Fe2OG dioxygenase domain-containing protein n=1 Tax=Mola mola TaxID=94237 RepID=A0A3Q4BXB9_MOLML
MSIPVVDLSAYSLTRGPEQVRNPSPEQVRDLSLELHAAFTRVGFVFLQNTGITQHEVDHVLEVAKRFFLQPEELKRAVSRGSFSGSPNHGWVSLETERLNPRRPGDLKEAFNTTSLHLDTDWSSGALADFRDTQRWFFLRCKELSLRLLRLMALSLDLDPERFLSAHRLVGTDKNSTTLRCLYYPPVDPEMVQQNQLRCGEHSDYGSITLLFQSSEGLQVRSRSGEFLSVPVVPGAVLVNIADLMQRWTSDRFVSVLHRVLLPPAGDLAARQSLAFFLQPDDEAVIDCCDGSNKYAPVTSGAYLLQRFSQSNLTCTHLAAVP